MEQLEIETIKKLEMVKYKIKSIEDNNKLHELYSSNILKAETAYGEYQEFKRYAELAIPMLETELKLKTQENLFIIEEVINLAFSKLHQLKNYRIKLKDYTFANKKALNVSIYSVDKPDVKLPIALETGKFMKQYMSICIQLCVHAMLGTNVVLLDEPVSNGDDISVEAVIELFNLFLTEKVAFYLIDQHPERFDSLPVHKIKLALVPSDESRKFKTEVIDNE